MRRSQYAKIGKVCNHQGCHISKLKSISSATYNVIFLQIIQVRFFKRFINGSSLKTILRLDCWIVYSPLSIENTKAPNENGTLAQHLGIELFSIANIRNQLQLSTKSSSDVMYRLKQEKLSRSLQLRVVHSSINVLFIT